MPYHAFPNKLLDTPELVVLSSEAVSSEGKKDPLRRPWKGGKDRGLRQINSTLLFASSSVQSNEKARGSE